MADFSDEDFSHSQAALNPMMEAMASILPWISKPQLLRFSPELNTRWKTACIELSERWAARAREGTTAIRPSVISLLSIAIESGDNDYLHFCEALASTADYLENQTPGNRLIATLTATTEALLDASGLENTNLPSRCRHFAQRLETAMRPSGKPGERSDILDALFIQDAEECLARMHEALDALPIDVYAIELEAAELFRHAEQIEMWGIYHQARQLQNFVLQLSDTNESTQDQAIQDIVQHLSSIEQTLRAVDC